ncbi:MULTISPECIES: hypothetical protein [Kamptonema]|uniref:hypothetical protein n=1 Tax=Kamptonema TaxID=1501433 RepID=UPI0001DAC563|nr:MULTISPECIES: hypothetical protein [Kamptonema]CBN56122.1 hypothetical protein OSCI_2780030 [Kamptonema sp. PCC 6506]
MTSSKKKQQVPDTVIKVGKKGTTYQQKTYQAPERAYGSTHEDSEDYEEVILDRSAAEIIDQINKRVKSPYYSIYCGIATLILLFVFVPLSIILAVVTYVVYKADVKRKTTPLFYEFSDDYSEKKFYDGIASFSNLSATKSSWRLKSQVAVGDWKRNAGSNSALIRQRAKIGKQNPNLLKTNVDVWGVDAGSIKLYLLPDRFFVFQDGVYSAISYNEVQVSLQDLEYVEQESLPSDATVIGKTWKYVRRDGEPDRRFNNNREIPIVRYGRVAFSSPSFIAYLIVSNLGIALSFTQSFSKIRASSSTSCESLSSSDSQFQSTLLEVNRPPEHLEPLKKAASQRSELTTNQIAQLLGVSTSFITKNSVSFEYEGFRFVRSGRSGRQISWKVEYLGNKL